MGVELEKVDQVVDRYKAEASMLIQIMQDVQSEYNWLPREAIDRVCERLSIPVSRAYRIASFYTLFSLEPRGRHVINVCLGTACHVRGAPRILEKVQDVAGVTAGHTTADLKYTLERVNCLGCCALGPVVRIDGKYFGRMKLDKVDSLLNRY